MIRLGKAIADAINAAGVKGYITNVEVDGDGVTVERTIEDSMGRPALFMDDEGRVLEVATAVETFDI